mmetsp:Transcript_67824/g.161891  ORF Transcript_67824/g.161891 Transcript_67824/m.161891 type:complete len:205 (-) Transcript_67824:735-1349(-)
MMPSSRMSFVTATTSGGSRRRCVICSAVSPSQLRASISAEKSTSTRTTSSAPRAQACIKGVHPLKSLAFASRPKSSKAFMVKASSSIAAQCTAVKPSRSFAAVLEPDSTSEGSSCQCPSLAATQSALTPPKSAWFTSSGVKARSGCWPSRFWSKRFTKSRWPDTQACISRFQPLESMAPASQEAWRPASCSSATTQAMCPPRAA